MTTTESHVTKNGQSYPKPIKELDVTTNSVVSVSDINNYLPNNGTRYNSKDGYIPNNSMVNFQTGDSLIVAMFNANKGAVSTFNSNWIEGEWNVIAKVPFII